MNFNTNNHTNLKLENDELRRINQEYETSNNDFYMINKNLTMELQTLKETIRKYEISFSNLKSNFSAIEKKCNILDNQNDSLNCQLSLNRHKIELLQEKNIKSEIKYEESLTYYKKHCNTLQNKLDKINIENTNQINEIMEIHNSDANKLRDIISKKDKRIKELKQLINTLKLNKSKTNFLETTIKEQDKTLKLYLQKNEELHKQCSALKSENTNKISNIEIEYSNKINPLNDKIMQLELDIVKKDKTIEILNETIKEKIESFKSYKSTMSLYVKNKSLIEINNELEECLNINDLNIKCKQLMSQIETHKQVNQELKLKLLKLTSEKLEIEISNETINNQKQLNYELLIKNTELIEHIIELQGDIETLKNKLQHINAS